MLDIQSAPGQPPHAVRREDYRPPDWLVPAVALNFALDPNGTRVSARLEVTRNGEHRRPLRLDGDGLRPTTVRVDGADAPWRMDWPALVIELPGDAHVIETEVTLDPSANSQLMGLYASRRASRTTPPPPPRG